MEYNYYENVKNCVKTTILDYYTQEEIKQKLEDQESREAFAEKLNEDLWVDDSVRDNDSGSYTFSAYNAECIGHNLDLLVESLEEFGESESDALSSGAEFCDVTIRCYLLSNAIIEALDELEEEI